jgi:hypothetical protein
MGLTGLFVGAGSVSHPAVTAFYTRMACSANGFVSLPLTKAATDGGVTAAAAAATAAAGGGASVAGL